MSTNNLHNDEARAKLKDLAESIGVCMMATNLKKVPVHNIPMTTKKVDAHGCIWFLSARDSEHNDHINSNHDAQLIYGQPSSMSFMTVYGKATIVKDRDIIRDLYSAVDNNWFTGPDDPRATAIKVEPEDAHYWDTKDNKLVALAKMGLGAISGQAPDLGEQGDLDL